MKKVIKTFFKISIIATTIIAYVMKKEAKKTTYQVKSIETVEFRKINFYEKYVKRIFDIACAVGAIVCFSPLYIIIALTVRLKLGSPVLFTQSRPGLIGKDGKETIFKMYKFRTMTDDRDENGALLPDEARLTKFGAWLRATSLDELPEAFNILNGTMSVIGPRPQLVRDMTFMTKDQRKRHTAKPGLSGLAQINGRNAITWDDKLDWDLEYIKKVNFFSDLKLILNTILKAFIEKEGITDDNMVTAEDLGGYLLRTNKVSQEEYVYKQKQAQNILLGNESSDDDLEEIKKAAINKKYSVLMSLYRKEKPEHLRLSLDSMINQSAAPDEIILVEDGPLTDELYDVLNEYDKYIHRVKNKKNLGLGLALNVGLEECRNELIARMDTDDCSKPNRCEKQLKRFEEKPYLSIVGTHIDEFVGGISNIVSQRKVPVTSEDIYEFGKRRSAFNHPTVMYKKSKVLEQGGYANLKRNQDVDLFGRMLFAGNEAENIDEALLWFRSSNELSKRRKSWQNTWSYIATIRKFWKMGYSSFVDYIIVGFAQMVMYVMPIKVQNFIYTKLLRR